MTREQALNLLNEKVQNKNLIKHMLAAEAIMKGLAKELAQKEETWALTGLLHDLDFEETKASPEDHGLKSAEILKELGIDEEIIYAIKAHNIVNDFPRQSLLDKALYATDPLTGLIVASALIHPEKRLSSIDVQFVLNRFKEKNFAAGSNREQIKTCSELGLDLEKFIEIGLISMQEISSELSL